MDTRRALLTDAFTQEPLEGSPAGLLPAADGLSVPQMRAIARELRAGTTAFLTSSGPADRRARYFTPAGEVDRCGHAAVAAHVHLHESGAIPAGEHTLETNAGVVDVTVEPDGRAWVATGDPSVRSVDLGTARVAEAIGVDQTALDVDGLPVALASTGRPLLVVPVRLLSDLGAAEPDGTAVASLADAVDVAGVFAFTFDTLGANSTLHGRTWSRRTGGTEEPVTAAASGAAAAYLRRFDAFDELPEELVVEGGHYIDRPGRAFVRAGGPIEVGGHAAPALDGEIRVPGVEEGDDIIDG